MAKHKHYAEYSTTNQIKAELATKLRAYHALGLVLPLKVRPGSRRKVSMESWRSLGPGSRLKTSPAMWREVSTEVVS